VRYEIMTLREEIDKIIKEGNEKNLSVDEITDKILALAVSSRKKEQMPIKEYEELIRETRRKIQEARKILLRSVAG